MDAEPRRIAHGERDHGRAGIDHEVDQAAVDPRLDQKMLARGPAAALAAGAAGRAAKAAGPGAPPGGWASRRVR
jgi:hypothetical protein